MRKNVFAAIAKPDVLKGLAAFLFIGLFMFLGLYRLQPPPALSANAPSVEFSAGRAMQDLAAIAQKPRPAGSPELAQAREYILSEFTALGLEPQIQEVAPIIARDTVHRSASSANVYNITARLKGTASTQALLVAGHYDSMVSSAEASGGGASVAIVLEVARALKAGPPPKNDVIFLLTSNWQSALGAKGFVEYNTWAQDVGAVLHFTARGTSGPSVMFETSSQNGWLLKEFAQSAPQPVIANSLANSIYQLLPVNSSDFARYSQAGWAGFNFAYFDSGAYHYTILNTPEKLDKRSLQHQGEQVLALTRHLGNVELKDPKAGNDIYFDLWGLTLIHYPETWAFPLLLLVATIYAGVIGLGLKRGQLQLTQIVVGSLVLVLTLVSACLLMFLLEQIILTLHNQYYLLNFGYLYNGSLYLVGVVFLVLAVVGILYTRFRNRIRLPNLIAGGLTIWLMLAIVTSLLLPGVSYLFLWPLLFSLLALGVTFILKSQDATLSSWRHWVVFSLGAIPGLVLFIPTVYLIYAALPPLVMMSEGVVISWLITGGFIVTLAEVLLLGLLIPQLAFMLRPGPRGLALVPAAIGILFLALGSLTAGFSPDRPKPNSVLYSFDADTNQSGWMSMDSQVDEWTAQFFPADAQRAFPSEWRTFVGLSFAGPAPAASVPLPNVVPLDDTVSNGLRQLHFEVTLPQPARLLRSYVLVDPATVRSVKFNGLAVNPDFDSKGLSFVTWGYSPASKQSAEIALETTSLQPIQIIVFGAYDGLPSNLSFRPRPAYMIPSPVAGEGDNVTIVRKSFELSTPLAQAGEGAAK